MKDYDHLDLIERKLRQHKERWHAGRYDGMTVLDYNRLLDWFGAWEDGLREVYRSTLNDCDMVSDKQWAYYRMAAENPPLKNYKVDYRHGNAYLPKIFRDAIPIQQRRT